MPNLIIGGSSQLSHYFPVDYHRISSRNIDFDLIRRSGYDSIYIVFAEQRTFLSSSDKIFNEINVDYTIRVLDLVKDYCKRVVIYSTSELWNGYEGKIHIDLPFLYGETPYIKSKELLCNYINMHREEYKNVVIIYPFNFNSPYRKEGFLFNKIFDSIINRRVNSVGDLDFERDIIHPSIIVHNSIIADSDKIIGSGELINIKKFTSELFSIFNLSLS